MLIHRIKNSNGTKQKLCYYFYEVYVGCLFDSVSHMLMQVLNGIHFRSLLQSMEEGVRRSFKGITVLEILFG